MTTTTPKPAAKPAAKTAVHAPLECRIAVATAHGENDAALAARVRAVAAALAAGTDVKTLAADMALDAKNGVTTVDGDPITAVSAVVLGWARGVLTTLDGMGVTLPKTGHVATLADTYRACKRHGAPTASKTLAGIAVNGKTPADKLAILADAAKTEKRSVRAAAKPKTKTPDPTTPTAATVPAGERAAVALMVAPTTATELERLLILAAGAVAKGRITPTPKTLAAVEALMAAVKGAAKPAATAATPATVAAATAAK